MTTVREAEYAEKGDYHRHLDKNWRYYPIYVAKMERVHRVLEGLPKEARIADLGCGEGVLVEELRAMGRDAIGVDLHYESEHVVKDDITGTRRGRSSHGRGWAVRSRQHRGPGHRALVLGSMVIDLQT